MRAVPPAAGGMLPLLADAAGPSAYPANRGGTRTGHQRFPAMSSESLHAPRERLSPETLSLHQATVSLMEELDAVDWYRQRADDTEDEALKALLLHNMREEMEHASMLLEWLRRADREFDGFLRTYLFSSGPITEIEKAVEEGAGGSADAGGNETSLGFTIGSLRRD